MRDFRSAAFGAFAACLLSSTAGAGPYSDLLVFGDSLSDAGNIANATLGLFPGPYYHQGRFSNGPVYADLLAPMLGLGTLTPSTLGGNNFAYGGAQTSGTAGPLEPVVKDVDDQVDAFLMQGMADPDALVIMMAGGNDLVNGQTDVNIPVGHIVAQLQRLIDAQARQFLVGNAPPLGFTPRFNVNAVLAAGANARSAAFNAALDAALANLQASAPDVTIFRLDVASLITAAVFNPTAFGLANVTAPAAPGLTVGAITYDVNQIVSAPDTYLFWDDLHPTARAHAFLAQAAFAAVIPEPSGVLLVVAATAFVLARRRIPRSHAPRGDARRRRSAARIDR
jgi:outer membrane lipase/esterase